MPTPWSHEDIFELEVDLTSIENKLDINGMTVDKEGNVISKLANDLYAAKNPYVGDMPANGKIAMILGIAGSLGNFDSELHTETAPYGWTLNFYDVSNMEWFDAQMKKYACILMALIDNLDEVSWSYMKETDSKTQVQKGTATSEECSLWVGEDIKGFGKSPEDVQRLLDKAY